MSYDDNVAWNPEKYGLVVLDQLYDPNSCYSFDDLVVWYHEGSNTVYWAQDSGCSCPSPFEDFNSLDDLYIVTKDSFNEFAETVKDHCAPYSGSDWTVKDYDNDPQAVDKVNLLSKVWGLVK